MLLRENLSFHSLVLYLVRGAGFPYEKHGSTIVFPSCIQKLISPLEDDPLIANFGAICLPPWFLSISESNSLINYHFKNKNLS